MGKKKKLINKKTKNNNQFKFLVTMLVLAIVFVFGVNLFWQNKEKKISSSEVLGSSIPVVGKTYWYGPSNTTSCKNMSGTCAYFNAIYSEGTYCTVNGTTGYINKGLCSGSTSTLCCSTRKPCYVNGNTYLDGKTFCNGISRVYVCDNGSQLYRGLDCATTGRMCSQGTCVNGTGVGAESCVAKNGICKTTTTGVLPTAGTACTVNGKAGKYVGNLCGGYYYGSNFMCCIPN